MSLLRQSRQFLFVGVLQLALDWLVLVACTVLGMPVSGANLLGRSTGALLGFWLNGRITFAAEGNSKVNRKSLVRFVLIWLVLTAISTWLIDHTASVLGLHWAWLAKPLVESMLAMLSFLLLRKVVFR